MTDTAFWNDLVKDLFEDPEFRREFIEMYCHLYHQAMVYGDYGDIINDEDQRNNALSNGYIPGLSPIGMGTEECQV